MIFDTHCHPNLAIQKDKKEVIKNFLEENPKGFLNMIWTNIKQNIEILKLSKISNRIYYCLGIHPCDSLRSDLKKDILELEKQLIGNKEKVIGIWECGLDYYWIEREIYDLSWDELKEKKQEKKETQKKFFEAQIDLALKYSLPLIIHNRESKDDIFEILVKKNFKNFVFHCYSEDLEFAEKLLNFSPKSMIGFSWIATFKNALEIKETAKNIPLRNIMIETDSPYLTPTPFRWKQENEPKFVKYVLEEIINLRNEEPEEVRKVIFDNSKNFFNLK